VSGADPGATLGACLAALRCGAQVLSLDAAVPAADLARNDLSAVVCDDWLGVSLPHNVLRIDALQVPGARVMPPQRQPLWSAVGTKRLAIDRGTLSSICSVLAQQAPLPAAARVLFIDQPARALLLTQATRALAAGAELLITTPAIGQDSAQLATLVRQDNIRLLHANRETWLDLLKHFGDQAPPLIAQIDVAESTPELITALLAAKATIVSVMRPAEIGVPVASSLVEHTKDTATFGHPLIAQTLDIVNPQGQTVAAGLPGELTVRGVATGSLARWRSDGVLQYLGEVGQTAYLAGQRIDLEAVERRLFAHDGVTRAIVTVRHNASGHRALVAYVQPKDAMPNSTALAEHVRTELPDHAVPTLFIELHAVPLLPSGGINFDALPTPSAAKPKTGANQATTRTPSSTELALADIWKKLLDVADVGPTDNFFDLGGNSLLAMRAVDEARRTLGLQIDARRYVFETLAQLANTEQAASATAANALPSAPPIKPKGLLNRVFDALGPRAGK